MTLATITQSGLAQNIQDNGDKVLISLVVKPDEKPLLVEVWGKNAKDSAKTLEGKGIVVTGELYAINNSYTITTADVKEHPYSPDQAISAISLVGRIGRDIDAQYFASGNNVAKSSIAVNGYKDREKTVSWFNWEAWNKTGERAGNFLSKGVMVGFLGSLNQESYTKKGSGEIVQLHKVIVSEIYLMPKSMSDGNQASSNKQYAATAKTSSGDDGVAF